MSVFRVGNQFHTRLIKPRYFSTILPQEDEYTATPNYPEILDLSYKKRKERELAAEHEAIKSIKTVEEKQIKLNMPKYYGFRCHQLHENVIAYNSLNFAQHITRTHLIVNEALPEYYSTNVPVDNCYIKQEVEEALLLEIEGYRREHDIRRTDLLKSEEENIISDTICKQLNRVIINKLTKSNLHLIQAQVDHNPRIETFWYVGGMNPSKQLKRVRLGRDWTKPMENDPVDRGFNYLGEPILTLRSELPLPPFISQSEAENPEFSVPLFTYDPRVLYSGCQHRFQANVPGFWAGDPHKFGFLSFHKRGHLLDGTPINVPEDKDDALHVQAILASFGWLHAQANLLGFNTFNDLTYPLTTQTVITNGQFWSFYAYQLNTTLINGNNYRDNPKRNVCFAVPEMKLFEEVKEGKFVGFNDSVLNLLLKFYCNVPKSRLGINMTPYLSQDEKVSADYEDLEKRVWLEREYKHLTSNRPRFKKIEEIYAWEKIYKIDNKTRFMDKKLRFFELGTKPSNRTLDGRLGKYIPRVLRPDLPRYKGRRAPEFWPTSDK